jgi:menaquinol-cytochrome c reductase iron-sulfur subunit
MSDLQLKHKETTRRKFLINSLLGIGGILGALVSIPVIGSLLEPVLRKTKPVWRSVGKTSNFKIGETKLVQFTNADPQPWAGATSQTASWLRRVSDDEFVAFSVNCTHLGCPVRWEGDAQLFLCPCHGGVYYKDGSNAAGPPPHPLGQYAVRVNKDEVEIQTGPIPITTD